MQLKVLSESACVITGLVDRPFRLIQAIEEKLQSHREIGSHLESITPGTHSIGLYFDSEWTLNQEGIQLILNSIEFPRGQDLVRRQAVRVPICYEMGLDLKAIALSLDMEIENVIESHLRSQLVCFSLGFCPGFGYCDILDPAICGLPRLASPRSRVEKGSVGITGNMSAIYPLEVPGGWNLIGRTPLEIVDVREEFFPIAPGTIVQYVRIDEAEFSRLKGERLEPSYGVETG